MLIRRTTLSALGVLVVGLGVIGSGYAATADNSGQCEIKATPANGMVTIQGVFHAPAALSGSYQLQVTSHGPGGSSNVSQGGDFTAVPGNAVTLGQVMLGSQGATYDVTLQVTTDGNTVQCKGRFGSEI